MGKDWTMCVCVCVCVRACLWTHSLYHPFLYLSFPLFIHLCVTRWSTAQVRGVKGGEMHHVRASESDTRRFLTHPLQHAKRAEQSLTHWGSGVP